MKRNLKTITIIAFLIIAVSTLVGCGNSKKEDSKKEDKDPIIGSWEYENGGYTYTFNEDGTGNYSYLSTKMDFTYTTDGNKISILYKGNTQPFETEFNIDGDSLNVKDSFGKDTIYKKQ